ncbi:hypothetical protein WJX72_008842 [[Myrmecia] bisecta]|uniref:RNase III domain-containing protein n=1 Tax=[Myrmecia] bisecta TaxID=41462 RepID=A0AAW1R9C4_9CHLO
MRAVFQSAARLGQCQARVLRCCGPQPCSPLSSSNSNNGIAAAAPSHGHAYDPFKPRPYLRNKLNKLARSAQIDKQGDFTCRVPTAAELDKLQSKLGHNFENSWLLRLAFMHSSAAQQVPNSPSNNSLAWMGDSALQLIVTEQLSAAFSATSLGDLTTARAGLVSRQACCAYAEQLGLQKLLVVGDSTPVSTSNMLAEAFEAVLGAVYVDGGIAMARQVFVRNFPLPREFSQVKAQLRKQEAAAAQATAQYEASIRQKIKLAMAEAALTSAKARSAEL